MSLHNDLPPAEERRLVKVYEMSGSEWFDRGTGLCHAVNNQECPTIYVESEEAPGRMLLETKIFKKEMFQKQQDTLIVWSDLDGVDMALSFQTPIGCASIWDFIHSAQDSYFQTNSQDDSLSDDPFDDYAGTFSLPFVPNFANLPEIEQRIQLAGAIPSIRTTMIKYILNNEYFPKLLQLVQEAEDLESLEDLHRLCNTMKYIILLNDNNIIELIVSDAVIDGVLTALEYDPDFPTHKANHRQFLNDKSRFREVIPIRNPAILRQIRHAWRLQYLKDVVLARSVDEPTFSVFNSLIYINQISIVQHLQSNTEFLCELFSVFNNGYPDLKKKEDAIRFIHQCASISRNLEHGARSNLLSSFISHGLFNVIHLAIRSPNSSIRNVGVDILTILLDYDAVIMRRFVLKSLDEETSTPLTDTLINVLHTEPDLGVKMQLSDAIKGLLEPTMFVQDPLGRPLTYLLTRSIYRPHNTQGTNPDDDDAPASAAGIFMRRHFNQSLKKLFEPFQKLEEKDPMSVTHQESALYEHLVEILSFFVRSHVPWGRRFLHEERLIPRVAQLLTIPYKKILTLTALKFFRSLLALGDTFFIGQMAQDRVFETLLDMIYNNMPRDNLLTSTCLEFFEYIIAGSSSNGESEQAILGGNYSVINSSNNDPHKVRDQSGVFMRPVVVHLVESYREKMLRITYVDTFFTLIAIHDSLRGSGEDLDETEVLDVSLLQQQQQELQEMQVELQQHQQPPSTMERETKRRGPEDEPDEDKRDIKRVKRLGKSFGALKEERAREANALAEDHLDASSDGDEEWANDGQTTHGKLRPLEKESLWLDRRTPSAGLQVSHPGSPVVFGSKPLVEYADDDDEDEDEGVERKAREREDEPQSPDTSTQQGATDHVTVHNHSSPPDKSLIDASNSPTAAEEAKITKTATPLSPSPSSSPSPPSSPSPSPLPASKIDRYLQHHANLEKSPSSSPTKGNPGSSPPLPQDQIVRQIGEKRRREDDDDGDGDDGVRIRRTNDDDENDARSKPPPSAASASASLSSSPTRQKTLGPRNKKRSFGALKPHSPASPSVTTSSPALPPPSPVMTTPTATGPRKVTPFIGSATQYERDQSEKQPSQQTQSRPPLIAEEEEEGEGEEASPSKSRPLFNVNTNASPSKAGAPAGGGAGGAGGASNGSKSPPRPSSPTTRSNAAASANAAEIDDKEAGSPDPTAAPLVAPRKMRRLGSRKTSFNLSGSFERAAPAKKQVKLEAEPPRVGPLQQEIQREKQAGQQRQQQQDREQEKSDGGGDSNGIEADKLRRADDAKRVDDGGAGGDQEEMHVDEQGEGGCVGEG